MHYIKAENPSEAWLKATHLIWNEGKYGGGLKWRNVLHLMVEIKKPIERNEVIYQTYKKFLGAHWAEEWGKLRINILEGKNDFVNIGKEMGEYERRLREHDQFRYIVYRLSKTPRLDQSFASLFQPKKDIIFRIPPHWDMPCLTALDFTYRDETGVNLFALFRSHDFGRKAYGNYQWLGSLLREVCDRSGRKMGEVLCFSCSAFIWGKMVKGVEKYQREKVGKVLEELKDIKLDQGVEKSLEIPVIPLKTVTCDNCGITIYALNLEKLQKEGCPNCKSKKLTIQRRHGTEEFKEK